MRSSQIHVSIDLDRIRSSAEQIRKRTRVALIAVIKADAYGLGADHVADAIASIVDSFAYFSIDEARRIRRPGLVLGPPHAEPSEHVELGLIPSIASARHAERYAGIPAALNLDTGMCRFGCQPEDVDHLLKRCRIEQAFTHATDEHSAAALRNALNGRVGLLHAAATSLLDHEPSWLDAVRPGLALFRGALRVTTKLAAVHDASGPVGYSRFHHPRVGVILGGYSNGLQPGPVIINARPQRLLEIGMNTSFVSVDPSDRQSDEVILLGGDLTESALADHFNTREHEILCRYSGMGQRDYRASGESVGRLVA